MPRPKAKGKKDAVSTEAAADKDLIFNGLKEEVVDDADALSNEVSNDETTDIKVKTTNGSARGGRGRKVDKTEKEEMPAKKAAAASKGRGKKKAEDVEVIAKEEENSNSNGVVVEEPKEEVVTKGKGGRGKRGAKDNVDNGEKKENGVLEEADKLQDVVSNSSRGRGGKKGAKVNKDTTEVPKEVASEKPAEEPKVADVKPATKTGGRKKKADQNAVAEATEEVVAEKPADTQVVETKTAAKTGGRKMKSDEKDDVAIANETEVIENSTDKQKEPPKKKGRAATKKTVVKEEEDAALKSEDTPKIEVETVKKPTKRGAKETTKEKTEAEKIPPKRARTAKANTKVEEAPVTDDPIEKAQPEETATKKRSRKEPSVEKDLPPVTEKPKKNRGGKRKVEKIDEESAVEPKQGKEEDKEEIAEQTEDSKKDEKPTTSRGGRKRAAPSANKAKAVDDKVDDDKNDVDVDDEADGSKPSKAKKRKEPSAAPTNATTTKYNKADFELPPLADGQNGDDEPRFNLKISSWNVAGLRSWVKKEGLKFLEYEEPDIFCLQETKCTTEQLPEEVARIPGYHPYWLCMPGGYAGVAIYSKIMPINVEYGIGEKEFDDVGRLITAEYEKFFLINVYVPNSGRKLVNLDPRMKWEKLFQEFVQKLNDRKPVVICGDMNVSHQEIDLANPKTNTRNAGFTKEERDKMSELLALGYVDSFRHLYPDLKGAYTFWTYMGNARSRNVGWRLDYFIVSERFIKRVVDNCIRSQCMGSDHCPITLFLKL